MSSTSEPAAPLENENAHEEQHVFVGTNALLCVMVLSLAMWIAHRIKKVSDGR